MKHYADNTALEKYSVIIILILILTLAASISMSEYDTRFIFNITMPLILATMIVSSVTKLIMNLIRYRKLSKFGKRYIAIVKQSIPEERTNFRMDVKYFLYETIDIYKFNAEKKLIRFATVNCLLDKYKAHKLNEKLYVFVYKNTFKFENE